MPATTGKGVATGARFGAGFRADEDFVVFVGARFDAPAVAALVAGPGLRFAAVDVAALAGVFLVAVRGAAFFATVFFATVFFVATFFVAAFFGAAFLAVDFFAVVFFATDFFAGDFFATDFFAAALRGADFFAAGFFIAVRVDVIFVAAFFGAFFTDVPAAALRAVDAFFATDFFAAAVLRAGAAALARLAADVFFAGAFRAAVFFLAGVFAMGELLDRWSGECARAIADGMRQLGLYCLPCRGFTVTKQMALCIAAPQRVCVDCGFDRLPGSPRLDGLLQDKTPHGRRWRPSNTRS